MGPDPDILIRLYHYMLSPSKVGLRVYTCAPCIFVRLWYDSYDDCNLWFRLQTA